MALGPQAPPGSPPRPRQVIIPAGAVEEGQTTILDVPGSPTEQAQRILIPPGTVRADETTLVVVPAPRLLTGPPSPHRDEAAERAELSRRQAQAQAQAQAQERERVRQAKLAVAAYLQGRTDPESNRLRRKLLLEADPDYQQREYERRVDMRSRFTEAEARRAEQELWGAELEELPDLETSTYPYRLHMSMNIEEYPPPPQTSRFDQALEDYGALSDVDAPESLYGEETEWEPPERAPLPPLIPPPPEEDHLVPRISPPRGTLPHLYRARLCPVSYVYQRHAPHDPADLMWEWEEPPRPMYEPLIFPEREPYSAELFRLVRL